MNSEWTQLNTLGALDRACHIVYIISPKAFEHG